MLRFQIIIVRTDLYCSCQRASVLIFNLDRNRIIAWIVLSEGMVDRVVITETASVGKIPIYFRNNMGRRYACSQLDRRIFTRLVLRCRERQRNSNRQVGGIGYRYSFELARWNTIAVKGDKIESVCARSYRNLDYFLICAERHRRMITVV